MKTSSLYILLLSFTAILSGCGKFLDEDSRSNIPLKEMFSTKEQVNAVVAGIYGALDANNFYHIRINEYAGDDGDISRGTPSAPAFPSSDMLMLCNGIASPADDNIYKAWITSYTAINVANTLLDNITLEGVQRDIRYYNQFIGEAKFLRAFHLFNLVRWFGDVPMPLKMTNVKDKKTMNLPRTSQQRVYQQIIDDLIDASQKLPNKQIAPNQARASRGTALAYLGKVHLTLAGYPNYQTDAMEKAEKYLDTVINKRTDFGYNLVLPLSEFEDVYMKIFDPEVYEQYGKSEYIFGIRPAGNDMSRSGYCDFFFNKAEIKPTGEFWQQYETIFGATNDARKLITCSAVNGAVHKVYPIMSVGSYQFNDDINNYFNYPTSACCFKYQDVKRGVTGYETLRSGYYFMRYTDVVMMKAEILCEKGDLDGARALIDPIRKRAFLAPLDVNMNKTQLTEEIRNERRREFMFEGVRRFDLLRWGIYVNAMKRKAVYTNQDVSILTNDHCYFPIPQQELKVNTNAGMYQNPGYGN